MMKVLQSIGVDWRDRRMISELYMNQEAVGRIAGGESDSGIIGRGVRQGCPLSPLLFSIYAEIMMKEALENVEEGIRVGGELIKDVKYADDQSVEQVSKFRYLGSLIAEDGRCLDDVKTRIGMAKDAFNKRKELLTRSI